MGWLLLLLVGWAYLAVKLRGFRPPRAVEERRPREEGLAAGDCVTHLPAVRVFCRPVKLYIMDTLSLRSRHNHAWCWSAVSARCPSFLFYCLSLFCAIRRELERPQRCRAGKVLEDLRSRAGGRRYSARRGALGVLRMAWCIVSRKRLVWHPLQ